MCVKTGGTQLKVGGAQFKQSVLRPFRQILGENAIFRSISAVSLVLLFENHETIDGEEFQKWNYCKSDSNVYNKLNLTEGVKFDVRHWAVVFLCE
jgi:hypothetical protein